MPYTADIKKILSNEVLNLKESFFYADNILKKIHSEHYASQQYGKFSADNLESSADYLNQLVWLGILWKSGDCYILRSRPPRGIAASSPQPLHQEA